jgi:hypothetical protein
MGIVKKPKTKLPRRNKSKDSGGARLLQMLEYNRQINDALMSGVSFEELEKQGIKFESV